MMAEPLDPKRTAEPRREVKQCASCERRFSREATFCPFDGAKLVLATVDPRSDPLIGAIIDNRYDVLDVLGEGGMGRVYKVRHRLLERPFAMKVLRRELASEPDLAERFIGEAKATSRVKHPGVVQVADVGRLPDGSPYFVMDLLVGRTLGDVIKAGERIDVPLAVTIIEQLAGALGAAHAAGIVHRDLKPENVFLVGDLFGDERDGSRSERSEPLAVRIVDFGAAKIIGASPTTRAGVVFGTPHYMSPEQASGETVDHRADIYALGVIMYEMFSGRVPFEADTYMGVLTQHMFVDPLPPSQASTRPWNLGELEAVCLRCLSKKPEHRFASMDDLVHAVDRAVRANESATLRTAASIHDEASREAPADPASERSTWSGEHVLHGFLDVRPSNVDSTLASTGSVPVDADRSRRVPSWLLAAGTALVFALPLGGWAAARHSARPAIVVVASSALPAPSVAAPAAPSASSIAPASTVATTVVARTESAPATPPPAPAVAQRPPAATAPHPARRVRFAPQTRSAAATVPIDDVGDPFATKR